MKKKVPSDYPTFAFRTTTENKEELSKLIDKAERLINKNLDHDEFQVRRNQIIYDALKIGLKKLIKDNK